MVLVLDAGRRRPECRAGLCDTEWSWWSCVARCAQHARGDWRKAADGCWLWRPEGVDDFESPGRQAAKVAGSVRCLCSHGRSTSACTPPTSRTLHNPHPRQPGAFPSLPFPQNIPRFHTGTVLNSSVPCPRRRCCATTSTRGTPPPTRWLGTCFTSPPWCGGPPPAWAAAWATTTPCPSRCCRACTEGARWWCAGEFWGGGRQRAAG